MGVLELFKYSILYSSVSGQAKQKTGLDMNLASSFVFIHNKVNSNEIVIILTCRAFPGALYPKRKSVKCKLLLNFEVREKLEDFEQTRDQSNGKIVGRMGGLGQTDSKPYPISASHLESLDLDEFFQSVDNEYILILVRFGDVSCVQPSILVNGLHGGFFIPVVTFHHLILWSKRMDELMHDYVCTNKYFHIL